MNASGAKSGSGGNHAESTPSDGTGVPDFMSVQSKAARVASHHGKIAQQASGGNAKMESSRVVGSNPSKPIAGFVRGAVHKRVPTHVASKSDKAAGAALLQEMKSVLPTPKEDIRNYDERRRYLITFCQQKIQLGMWQENNVDLGLEVFHARLDAAEALLSSYVQLHPHDTHGVPANQVEDFIETLSERSPLSRVPMQVPEGADLTKYPETFHRQSKKSNSNSKVQGFPEMPVLSTQCDLKFSGGLPTNDPPFITTMGRPVEQRHRGIVVWNKDGHIDGVRAHGALELNTRQKKEIKEIQRLAAKHKEHLKRRPSVLNVCENFFAFGQKKHRDTQLSSTYTMQGQERHEGSRHGKKSTIPQNNKALASSIQLYERMQNFAKQVMIKKLKTFYFLEILAVELFYASRGVQVWTDMFTSATLGSMFWPKSHVDPDLTWSGLLCMDTVDDGVLGGDWSFPESGWVLKTYSGSVLLYGPWNYHATTKMDVNPILKWKNPKRFYTAFYGKEAVVYGIGAASASETRRRTKQ